MPSFVEERLPEAIAKKATGGPAFATRVVSLNSGHEQRNANWSAARASYSLQGVDSPAEMDTLRAFFYAMQGRTTGFRFKDWGDYQGIGQVIGTGDGSTTQFQLIKVYAAGATTVSRTITKPVSGTVSIYKDSVLQASGVTVDTATGIVTFSSAPANGVVISADFAFDVPVRFDTDRFDASVDSNDSQSWNDIALVEVRV